MWGRNIFYFLAYHKEKHCREDPQMKDLWHKHQADEFIKTPSMAYRVEDGSTHVQDASVPKTN